MPPASLPRPPIGLPRGPDTKSRDQTGTNPTTRPLLPAQGGPRSPARGHVLRGRFGLRGEERASCCGGVGEVAMIRVEVAAGCVDRLVPEDLLEHMQRHARIGKPRRSRMTRDCCTNR